MSDVDNADDSGAAMRRRSLVQWEPWRDTLNDLRAAVPDEIDDDAVSRLPGAGELQEALQEELDRLRDYLGDGVDTFARIAEALTDAAAGAVAVDEEASASLTRIRQQMEGS